MIARRILSESAVNRQVELGGNAITGGRGSSVKTPWWLSRRRDIFAGTLFPFFFCNPTAIPRILQRREHALGTQLVVTGPLIEHANEALVALLETLQCLMATLLCSYCVFMRTQSQGVHARRLQCFRRSRSEEWKCHCVFYINFVFIEKCTWV